MKPTLDETIRSIKATCEQCNGEQPTLDTQEEFTRFIFSNVGEHNKVPRNILDINFLRSHLEKLTRGGGVSIRELLEITPFNEYTGLEAKKVYILWARYKGMPSTHLGFWSYLAINENRTHWSDWFGYTYSAQMAYDTEDIVHTMED